MTLFSIWLTALPWRKYWKVASKIIVMFLGFGIPSLDLADSITYGRVAAWLSYLTIALSFMWAALYFSKSSQARTLQSTVMRQGMIKADAIISYKVWPESGDEYDVRSGDKE